MKFKHALMYSIILSSILYFVGFSNVHAADEATPANSMAGMTFEMQKSMDPNTWMQMMQMMMDPNATAMASCALCHEGEDLARYQKEFGPMMDVANNMYKAAGPHQAAQYMNPMMGMMNPSMMSGMMNPMMGMMNPMMSMMGPMMNPMSMMGMMGPMMGMMGPMMNPMGMMGGGMNPMSMMNPMGMMGGMMNPMGMMGGMSNPMGMMGGGTNANPMGNMMQPDQYADWFKQMTEMMQNFAPAEKQ